MYSDDFLKLDFLENISNREIIIQFIHNHLDIIAKIIKVFLIFIIIICIIKMILLISKWKIYDKADKNGWASIIPIYDNYVLFEIVEIDGAYAFLTLVPFIGKIFIIILKLIAYFKLAKYFKKDLGFALGLVLLRIIFLPILAFDSSVYTKEKK